MSDKQRALDAYRRERIAKLLARYPADDSPELTEVPLAYITREGEGAAPCPTYAAVVKHEGDGDHAIGIFNRQRQALDFLASEYPEWHPIGLFHLGTGESIPFDVFTTVRAASVAGVAYEPDVTL